jgi:ribonuclease BN (tRNA processing enzyme)
MSLAMMNEIVILGAYGTKAKKHGTSSFYIDEKNVIDAGNLLSTLQERSADVEHIWLTHSHLDHICDIAYIIDNYFALRTKTLCIHGLPATLKAVEKHFLNDLIWPDFSKIAMNNSTKMTVLYEPIELNVVYEISEEFSLEAFKTDHTVPSCGYIVKKEGRSIVITADTYSLDTTIELINSRVDIGAMIIECSFPSNMSALALESKHLTPKILFEKLKELKREDVKLYINHIKPLYLEVITEEIEAYRGKWEAFVLKDEEIVTF